MGSWSPQADEVLLLSVVVREDTTSVSNVAGNGLTWTLVEEKINDRGQMSVSVFRASSSSTPTVGAVTFDHDTGDPVTAVLTRISGADISTTDGIEANASASGGDPDDDDMQVSVTTLTDGAKALALGGHRGSEEVDNLPAGQTIVFQDTIDCGSGGDRVRNNYWEEDAVVSPAGAILLGQDASISGDAPWAVIGVAITPAAVDIDLDANLSIALTIAPDLTASGELDAALNIVLTTAADLTAAGELDAALNLVLTVVADLTSDDQLNAALSIVLTVAADLTAAGELNAAMNIVLSMVSNLTAVGQLDAALTLVLAMASDLNALGQLEAALDIVLTVNADLTEAGQLEAALELVLTVDADLTEAVPAPVVGVGSGAPSPPTTMLTQQQVFMRKLQREDEEAAATVVTHLEMLRK